MSPWNGGSGFWPQDRESARALAAIEASEDLRLAPCREVIQAAHRAIQTAGLDRQPKERDKVAFLRLLRNTLPDSVLPWLDLCWSVQESGKKFTATNNPLVGAGGNEGRWDYSTNYAARVLWCLGLGARAASREERQALLEGALVGESAYEGRLTPGSGGPWFPGAVESPASPGPSLVNPWDLVFAVEGALLFAPGMARRAGSLRNPFPFVVTPFGPGATQAGLSELADSPGEFWAPLWERPATVAELGAIFSAGEVYSGTREASTGVAMTIAATAGSVPPGISGFERYTFLRRSGQNRIAVHRGHSPVHRTGYAAWEVGHTGQQFAL